VLRSAQAKLLLCVHLADDVSDTEKLLAVMHSKNVNFTQEAIKIIIHLMALGTLPRMLLLTAIIENQSIRLTSTWRVLHGQRRTSRPSAGAC
jgi:hypothetical protein